MGLVVDASLTFISTQGKAIAKVIGDSFARVKTELSYRSPTEVHHLVAKGAFNARLAKDKLWAVGIGVEDGANKIRIKTGLHRRIHTDLYYGWANSVVISAYDSANGIKEKQKKNVYMALEVLRSFVFSLNELAPF